MFSTIGKIFSMISGFVDAGTKVSVMANNYADIGVNHSGNVKELYSIRAAHELKTEKAKLAELEAELAAEPEKSE